MLDTLKRWLGALSSREDLIITLEEINGILYPAKKSILILHDYIIKEFKFEGDPVHDGILSDGVLSFYGIKYYEAGDPNDKRKDILLRGAKIFDKFLQAGHPFVDGNKRTGFITLWAFLFFNKVVLSLPPEDYRAQNEMIKKWADNRYDNTQEIYNWLNRYSRSI